MIKLEDMAHELSLECIFGKQFLSKEIFLAETHYPSLEFAGFISRRETSNFIHVLLSKESNYLNKLDKKTRESNLLKYFSSDFSCLIIPKDVKIPNGLLKIASDFDKPILLASHRENEFQKRIKSYLIKVIGPEIIINNFALLEVFGIGILLAGNEDYRMGAILELIRRKHRLIAEGIINIKKLSSTLVVGSSLDIEKDTKHFVKLSDNQIIKVSDYFGIGSIRNKKEIDLLIKIENWNDENNYDRLGVENIKQNILGVEITKIVLPLKKGRNISTLIEVAAMSRRLEKRGKSSVSVFMEKITKLIKSEQKLQKGLKIKDIKQRFQLRSLNRAFKKNLLKIKHKDIARPSIEFIEGFKNTRDLIGKIHVIGDNEIKYLSNLSEKKRDEILNEYFAISFPCLIICSETKPNFIIQKAKNIALFQTNRKLNNFVLDLYDYIVYEISEGVILHGVFLEIFGIGVLLTGKSGLGKSETALELIHRGHRLVSDDATMFKKLRDGRIIGKAFKIPYFMEIRGLGIIDIKTLYGVGAVKTTKELNLIIELKELEKETNVSQNYSEEYKKVLGRNIKKINFYLTPGRNISSIIEILTMKFRRKN